MGIHQAGTPQDAAQRHALCPMLTSRASESRHSATRAACLHSQQRLPQWRAGLRVPACCPGVWGPRTLLMTCCVVGRHHVCSRPGMPPGSDIPSEVSGTSTEHMDMALGGGAGIFAAAHCHVPHSQHMTSRCCAEPTPRCAGPPQSAAAHTRPSYPSHPSQPPSRVDTSPRWITHNTIPLHNLLTDPLPPPLRPTTL